MKISSRSRAGRRAVIAAAAAMAVGASVLAAPAHAEPAPPADCPATLAVSDISPGTIGEGWTVVTGRTPQPFQVEVLGVLPDGVGAGRDMVVIEVSDLPGQTVVGDRGIWAGMSGSPVYVDGKLLGAIAYGFTGAPSPIGGLTPAADMMNLLGMSGAAAAKAEIRPAKTTAKLSANARKALDARATAAVPASTLERLRTPLSVSGLSSKRLRSLQQTFDAAGRPVIAYAGSRAAVAGPAAVARPQAGGNFAAMATYGDVSIGGVGTTTAVCGSYALAFGHPMAFAGKVTYGASDASSIAIIRDSTFGSFKMATVGDPVGLVDQDRMAGLRARLGAGPSATPIVTTIENLDTGAAPRTGTTWVAEPDYLPLATAYGIWSNFDSTFDKIGRGLATSTWTITGTRAGGKPFTVSRSNRWADLADPSVGLAFEAADAVDALNSNEYEPVTITGVTLDSKVSSAYKQLRITKLAVSVNGGKYTSASTLKVKPGAVLTVKTTLRAYRSSTDETVLVTLKVPKSANGRSGVLSTLGGLDLASDDDGGAADPGCLLADCEESEGSLDSVIKGLNALPRNNQVLVDLLLDPATDGGKQTIVSAKASKRAPVTGQKYIAVIVRK